MFSLLAKIVRQLRCRHRWRPDRRYENREWCDLCRAKRKARA